MIERENGMKKVNKNGIYFCVFFEIMFGYIKYIMGVWFYRGLGGVTTKAILLNEVLCFAIISVLAGICIGFGALIAKSAKENEIECKMLVRNGFYMTIALSLGIVIICMLCKRSIVGMLADSPKLHELMLSCFERRIIVIPFVTLFSYIMVLFRAMGDFKTPCLFIVTAVLLELGMTRFIIDISGDTYCMQRIVIAEVILNILLFLIAYIYYRVRYSNWYQGKVNIKWNWNVCRQFFKAGEITGGLGLPLVLMALVESKRFMGETNIYHSSYLLFGALIMAPFMARFIIEKYSVDD